MFALLFKLYFRPPFRMYKYWRHTEKIAFAFAKYCVLILRFYTCHGKSYFDILPQTLQPSLSKVVLLSGVLTLPTLNSHPVVRSDCGRMIRKTSFLSIRLKYKALPICQ